MDLSCVGNGAVVVVGVEVVVLRVVVAVVGGAVVVERNVNMEMVISFRITGGHLSSGVVEDGVGVGVVSRGRRRVVHLSLSRSPLPLSSSLVVLGGRAVVVISISPRVLESSHW